MSQKQVFDYATQSSQTNSLKPVLAAALSSLEVQLDQELIRYRRTRTVSKAVAPGRVGNPMETSAQSLNLSGAIAKVVTPFPTTASTPPTPPTPIKSTTPITPVTEIRKEQEIPSLQPQEAEDLFSVGAIKAEELQQALNSESTTISGGETEISASASGINANDGNGSSGLVKALQTAKNRQAKVETENLATEPSDYLESSEALLRSLTEEQPQTKKRSKSNNNSLLSPLGIGSMLLVLVACSALGFVLVNPKNVPIFGFGGSSEGNSGQKAQENQANTTAKNTSSSTAGQVQPTPIEKYPNLATEQFPEVNSANDVVGLKPKEKPAPIPTNAPALQNPTLQNPVATVPVQPVPVQPVPVQPVQPIPQNAPAAVPVVPPLTTAPGTPKAATTAPTATSPEKAAPKLEAEVQKSGGWYRLSIPNQGADTLAAAKKAVPEAYVSDDGKLIYLGAFKNERQAAQALKELEAQGIKAKRN